MQRAIGSLLMQRSASLTASRSAFSGAGRALVGARPVLDAREYRSSQVVAMGRRAAKNAARKGKTDALKAKLYGRMGKMVFMAVRNGGSDPDTNKALADAIKQAQASKVPKDIVERNMKRASDAKAADMMATTYEVYGPGGTGWVIECLSDNTNRAREEVWQVVKKADGKMAESGSVLFNFKHQAEFMLDASVGEEGALDAAMEAGADDMEPVGDEPEVSGYKVVAEPSNFATVRDSLAEAGLPIIEEFSGLKYAPLQEVEVDDDELFEKCEWMMEKFLDSDDVDAVYTNCEGVAA